MSLREISNVSGIPFKLTQYYIDNLVCSNYVVKSILDGKYAYFINNFRIKGMNKMSLDTINEFYLFFDCLLTKEVKINENNKYRSKKFSF